MGFPSLRIVPIDFSSFLGVAPLSKKNVRINFPFEKNQMESEHLLTCSFIHQL